MHSPRALPWRCQPSYAGAKPPTAELGAAGSSPKPWTCRTRGGSSLTAPAACTSNRIWCYASVIAGGHCLNPAVHRQKSVPEEQGHAVFLGRENGLWVQQPGLAGGKGTRLDFSLEFLWTSSMVGDAEGRSQARRQLSRSRFFEQVQPRDRPPWSSRHLEIWKHTEMQARSQEKPAKQATPGKHLLHCLLEALETERASQLTSAIPCFFLPSSSNLP